MLSRAFFARVAATRNNVHSEYHETAEILSLTQNSSLLRNQIPADETPGSLSYIVALGDGLADRRPSPSQLPLRPYRATGSREIDASHEQLLAAAAGQLGRYL